MTADYLKDLNPPQREAVCHTEGSLLVLAGAGSGKTRVITYRICHLVAGNKIRADNILGVTFTNKAAAEMKERVIKLLGPPGRWVRLSTFHSFCARLLRDHIMMLGYKRDYTIYDEADSLALLKRIIKDLGIPENQPSPGLAQNLISRAKDRLIPPSEYAESAVDYISQNAAKIYSEYQSQLKKSNALDFDDLLFITVLLFDKHPEILSHYQKKFPYILLDEYKDTNYAQYRLVKLLAGENKNVCVVGDDDQSIYSWRGADINNILNFEADFPGCKVVRLEQNYRSTKIILDASFEVIRRNSRRKPKKLFTQRAGGDGIALMLCGDERDEAEAVALKIKLGLQDIKTPSDYAILFRTHAQSRAIEDALRDSGIPYTIVGGVKFYERKEIKDIIAYLRLLINPDDTESLLRIINVPRRGIGRVTVERILKTAASRGESAFGLLSTPDEVGIRGKAGEELKKLHAVLMKFTSMVNDADPSEIAEKLIKDTGYIKMLEDEGTIESETRRENIFELVNAVYAFEERAEEELEMERKPLLRDFLEEVALISEIDTWNNQDETVVLMTLHAAKGLEFDSVFLTGMEEGLFPLIRESQTRDEFEEERRLCYVGVTRAKNKLYLSMAGFRRRFNDYNRTMPSSFLQDLPENLLEVERFNYYDNNLWGDTFSIRKSSSPRVKKRKKNNPVDYSDRGFETDEHSVGQLLKVGATVAHNKFGTGRIIGKEGRGEGMILTIRFAAGVKKIMPMYTSLEVLG
jgi:DNA helicase-2/ATP-dependent DNA helicase PcrA